MSGYLYIVEHPDRPGWIHIGRNKKKNIQQALWCLNRDTGLRGNFQIVIKIKTKKPRFVYRAILLWLAPYRVSAHFHRYDRERATSLLMQYVHNAKALFGKKGPWPVILPEDQRFFEMMDRAKDLIRNKKYGKEKQRKKTGVTYLAHHKK